MNRLYVLVRTDLKGSSPAVQAGHAVAQFMLEHPDCEWENGYLIYLKIPSLTRLNNWKSKIHQTGQVEARLLVSDFSEPDLNNELTAIAVYGADP